MNQETPKTPLSVITENGQVRHATCSDCQHLRNSNQCRAKFGQAASATTCHYTPSRYSGPGKHKVTQEGIDMSMKHFSL